MTTDAIYEERGSDWSQQDLVMGTTRWLQNDQTLPLSAKGVACETMFRLLQFRLLLFRLLHILLLTLLFAVVISHTLLKFNV